MPRFLSLDTRRALGSSTLEVAPICLGTAAFGPKLGQAVDAGEARRVFDIYVDRGGNFVDAATPSGNAEQFVGEAAAGRRNSLIIATKCRMATRPDDPPDRSHQRVRLSQLVEASLRRLASDRIDLLYLQLWDDTISSEVVMQGIDDLVQSGKVRHAAIANAPAPRIAEMQLLADMNRWPKLVASQTEYNVVQRSFERQFGPAGTALGDLIVAWAALPAHVLEPTPAAEAVRDVAVECGATSAQVALAWTLLNRAVVAPIISVRTPAQLDDKLAALRLALSRQQQRRLSTTDETTSSVVRSTFPQHESRAS